MIMTSCVEGSGKWDRSTGEENLAMRRRLPVSLVFLCFLFYVFQIEARSKTIKPEDPVEHSRDETEEKRSETRQGQTFYKWTDEKGDLFFTDDLDKVPASFREDVEIIELPPVPEVEPGDDKNMKVENGDAPGPVATSPGEKKGASEEQRRIPRDPYVYREIPFDQFIRITTGMDEAEVLSRLGFPTLITPSDYFHGDRARYRSRIVRFIYLGERARNEKTTIVEIRDGKVVNTERIFP
jgi:hypothetical protein